MLSGGDNVSPARVEGFLVLQPEINQAMVHGDRHPHLVALLVPDADFIKTWARRQGVPADLARLAEDRGVPPRLRAGDRPGQCRALAHRADPALTPSRPRASAPITPC